MISKIIAWCAHNPFIVFAGAILLTVAGVWSLHNVPLDALPDISDVQVIIHTEWAGDKPPDVVEDQVTYPHRHVFAVSSGMSKACARKPCSVTRVSSSSSRMAPISTGRARA